MTYARLSPTPRRFHLNTTTWNKKERGFLSKQPYLYTDLLLILLQFSIKSARQVHRNQS